MHILTGFLLAGLLGEETSFGPPDAHADAPHRPGPDGALDAGTGATSCAFAGGQRQRCSAGAGKAAHDPGRAVGRS